jgi:hypothetical protein
MSRIRRFAMIAFVLTTLAFGAVVLSTPVPAAGDNPCDPTIGLIRWCKANHGHFDTSCCCCVGAH